MSSSSSLLLGFYLSSRRFTIFLLLIYAISRLSSGSKDKYRANLKDKLMRRVAKETRN